MALKYSNMLRIDLRAHLTIPGHDPAQRFLCLRIQEETDAVQLQSPSGPQVTIPLSSRAGRSTSVTLRDVLAINFPAVRDVHQLRAVLTDTPLCEVHGTARTDHHRQGILLNLMASDERAPWKGASISPPSRATVPDVEDTVVHEHTAQDGPLGLEAPPSEDRHPSRSPGPDKEAVTLTGPTLSWFGATSLLREKLQTLKGRAKQGPLKLFTYGQSGPSS